MIVHDAGLQFRPEPARSQHKEQRDKLAERLIRLWTDFTIETAGDLSITTSDIGIAAIGMPAALAVRAQAIRNIPDPNGRALVQGPCAERITNINNGASDLQAKYENIKPPGEPTAPSQRDAVYQLGLMYQSKQIRNMICAEQVALDVSFYDAEKKLAAAVKKSIAEEMDERTLLGKSDILVSLVTCVPTQKSFAGWTGHDICVDKDFDLAPGTPIRTQPFAEWLVGTTQDQNVGPRYAMVR